MTKYKSKQHRIICAAIWIQDGRIPPYAHQPRNISNGYVICGLRHLNCITTVNILTGKTMKSFEYTQGFLTSDNKFVNRKEAFWIALHAKQIPQQIPKELHSEDIY